MFNCERYIFGHDFGNDRRLKTCGFCPIDSGTYFELTAGFPEKKKKKKHMPDGSGYLKKG